MTHWKTHWTHRQAATHSPSEPLPEVETLDDNTNRKPDIERGATTRRPSKREHTFLTTGEAANFLRLSPRTLERFRVEGTGPSFTKAGPGLRARVLYRRSDLEAWLDSYRFVSTSQYE